MNVFGIGAQALISSDYRVMQEALHAGEKAYGERGYKWAEAVISTARWHFCHSILDYGAGARTLATKIHELTKSEFIIREYDPAVPAISALPNGFSDLVVCTDVLEHVEADKIDAVLNHLTKLARKAIFVAVALVETEHRLTDGRQAHILLRPAEWWAEQFEKRGWVVVDHPPASKPEKCWTAVMVTA